MSTFTTDPAAGYNRRADIPIPEADLDADLASLVRRTSLLRQGFYCVVLLVALAGQVSGAVETLHIPLAAAIPAVAALELGGIVVLANADVRRRLGERATFSRALSAGIAAWAVAFNWLAHADHLLGAFFASMSALGYLVWLMHTENQRRDRLRVKGDLPPTTPAYELAGHWLRHPWLTLRARALAKADPRLGLYDSLTAARAEIRRERRESAIAKVLHRKIRAAVDPRTADIAIAVYDLDEVAVRLAAGADYDGLAALIQADLAPERIAPTVAAQARRAAADAVPEESAAPHTLPSAVPAGDTDAQADAEPDWRQVRGLWVPGTAETLPAPSADPRGAAAKPSSQPRPNAPSSTDALGATAGRTTKTRTKPRAKRGKHNRTDADLIGELTALADSGTRLSVRSVSKALHVGAPKARALLAHIGVSDAGEPAAHINGHTFGRVPQRNTR